MKAQKAIIAVTGRLLKVVHTTLETLTVYQKKGTSHFVDLQAKVALYYQAQLACLKRIAIDNTKRTKKVIE